MIASLSAILILLAGSALAVPVEHQKRASGVPIRQDSVSKQCLVLGGVPADGVSLTTVPCAQVGKDFTKTGYGLFDISKGDQLSIRVTGTNFCLDAGSNPSAALGEGKIWTCYPGAPQQRWFYTDDNHIAITGGDTCLSTGRYGVFTIGCGSNSGAVGSQGWLTGFPTGPTTTAVTTTASATSTTPVTSTPVSPPPPPPVGGAGAPLYWNGDKTKCLTVNGAASDGQALVINNCLGNTAAGRASQYWTIAKGAGAVKLANTNYCLDFGLSPANGAIGKIWTCYDGAPQQNAYYTDDNHIALTGGSVCLDVRAESSPPKTVQQWQCSGSNGNQIFTL